MTLIIAGLLIALIGVANIVTSRRHPNRPNVRLSRGLGYVGVVVGSIWIVYGTLQATGIIVPAPEPVPTAPAAAPVTAPAPTPAATRG